MYQDAINDIYCDRNQEYFSANLDGNQVLYVDFENKTVVITIPSVVDPISWDTFYGMIYSYAYNEMKEFQDSMEYIAGQLGYPPEAKGKVQLFKSTFLLWNEKFVHCSEYH